MNDFGDQPSVDDIGRSDAFIDALAGGRQAAATDDTDAMLAAMLGDWRDELRWPPESELVSEADAFAALQSGLSQVPAAKPGRRHLTAVGAAAAAVLCLGGFGAVVAGSGPGDALYGLRTMLFGAPKQVRTDQVALAAQAELYQVQQLIARGDWQQAQDRLVAVSNQVAAIGDEQQKQELFNQWNQLSARVVQRDPEATVPPGITYTVLPSVNELVPTPAPTTLPSMPPITLSVPSGLSPTVPVVSATGSPAPTPSATAPSDGPLPSTSAPTGEPSTSVPTSQAQQTQGATTSAPAATSVSPSPSTSAPGTTAAQTTAAQTTAAQTTAAQTTAAQTTAAQTTAAQTTAAATSDPTTTSALPSPTPSAASPTPSAASPTPSALPAPSAASEPVATPAATVQPSPTAQATPTQAATQPMPTPTAQPTRQAPSVVITTTARAGS